MCRFLVVMVSLLLCGSAFAHDAKKRAQAHFKAGQAAYEAEDFEKALRAFEAAYDAVPAPALFFNMAQCHRKMNDHARAVESLEKFLELAKNVPDKVKEEAQQQLAEERKLLDDEEKAKAAAAPPPNVEEPAPLPAAAAKEPDGIASEDPPLWQNPFVIGGVIGTVVVAAGAATFAALSFSPGPTPPSTTLGVVDLR